MTDSYDLPHDWTLRINVTIYFLNDICRCHLYKNGGICVRCTNVKDIKEKWPVEWALACQAYAESKSREQKDGK